MSESICLSHPLVPAKAGTQLLDSRFRGNERSIELRAASLLSQRRSVAPDPRCLIPDGRRGGAVMEERTVRARPMLSALDLVRRVEGGELTPRAVVELCADAIAARENEVGAFVAHDLDAARRLAADPHVAAAPLRGLPLAFK